MNNIEIMKILRYFSVKTMEMNFFYINSEHALKRHNRLKNSDNRLHRENYTVTTTGDQQKTMNNRKTATKADKITFKKEGIEIKNKSKCNKIKINEHIDGIL